MDPKYKRKLSIEGYKVLTTVNPIDMIKITLADILINDHGSQALILYKKLTNMKFVDVWHGIPYKGFDHQSFTEQKYYDEIWVSSPGLKIIYEKKFAFNPKIIKSVGYARVDKLVKHNYNKREILKRYSIPEKFNKYVLIAPSWQHYGGSIIPFGENENNFFTAINRIAKINNTLIIFRSHLNTTNEIKLKNKLSNIMFMAYGEYPVAEEFLWISNILVSDWSSIHFDYLVLKRPTIFLDAPAPVKEGFTLGKEYRFGKVVKNLEELTTAIDIYLNKPEKFLKQYSSKINNTIQVAYGNTLDGKSSERYYKKLSNLINI